ncbi:hypothetical protein QUF31_21365 [Dickeya chrysanthemi]|uniref:hypothetical protein n=1 Tax=Dickeya chrysanthemi TaxID=556 RepID=UPI0025A1C1BF|nr:hypothetical protein [Dickeya chrysanthemi]WJM85511.1 hypothetical protein QUF31_21365 [Dickeya chrysanthemi]
MSLGDVGTGKSLCIYMVAAGIADQGGRSMCLFPNSQLAVQMMEDFKHWAPDLEMSLVTAQAYDNVQNKRFDDPTMTNALRAEAMRTPGRTVWAGTRVNREAALILDPRTLLRVTAPASAAGKYEVGFASFGPLASAANFPAKSVVTVMVSTSGTDDSRPTRAISARNSEGSGPIYCLPTNGWSQAYRTVVELGCM